MARRTNNAFGVALIAFISNATGLGAKPVGARVHLEVDVIAKYVESLLATRFGSAAGSARMEGQ